jgi:serine/threonine-protein kinase
MPRLDSSTTAGSADAGRNGSYGQSPQKKSKVWIGIIVVILVLAAILGVGYALGFLGEGSKKIVPELKGRTAVEASRLLEARELKIGDEKEAYSLDVEAGKIISQDPKAQSKVKPQTKVNIVVSKGPELGLVPDLTKKTKAEAEELLKGAGFRVTMSGTQYSNEVDANLVLSQNPKAGTQLARGKTVSFVISLGAETGTVPDVMGESSSRAQQMIQDAGFKVSVKSAYSDTVKTGRVMDQNPTEGIKTSKGTLVTITVSQGPQPSKPTTSTP